MNVAGSAPQVAIADAGSVHAGRTMRVTLRPHSVNVISMKRA